MVTRNLSQNLGLARSISPQLVAGPVDGAGVDIREFDSALFCAIFGLETGIQDSLPIAQESDDDITYTNVAAADLQGAFVNGVQTSIQKVGYRGFKRYIRVRMTITANSINASAVIAESHAHQAPVA